MRIPQPIIPLRAPPQPVQVLCSGKGDEINVPYIRCLDGQVPETYELWALAEDRVREVQPYARVARMRLPQPIIPFRAPPQPVQVLLSGRGDKIDVPYIRCLNGRVPL